METQNLTVYLYKKTADIIAKMVVHQNIEIDAEKAQNYLNTTFCEKIFNILEQLRKEQEEIANTPVGFSKTMTKWSFEINLTHALLQYAKEVVNYSKIDVSKEVI